MIVTATADHSRMSTVWRTFAHLKTFTDVTCVNRERDEDDPPEDPQSAGEGQLIIPRLDETVAIVPIDFYYVVDIRLGPFEAHHIGLLGRARRELGHDDVACSVIPWYLDLYRRYVAPVVNGRWNTVGLRMCLNIYIYI